ncbi:hypothetical protein HRbin15_02577 [bacterium HR15]|nr:hypothetical protein HRbin15_02577 [bacterium HR15]
MLIPMQILALKVGMLITIPFTGFFTASVCQRITWWITPIFPLLLRYTYQWLNSDAKTRGL